MDDPSQNHPHFLYRHRPIFPGSLPPSIFGTNELIFCVRYGNRWDLVVIDTGSGAAAFNRCYISEALSSFHSFGDPWGNRTPVTGVRGRCLNRLTNGPHSQSLPRTTYIPFESFGAPSGIRTRDPLIKSQLLYQLS